MNEELRSEVARLWAIYQAADKERTRAMFEWSDQHNKLYKMEREEEIEALVQKRIAEKVGKP